MSLLGIDVGTTGCKAIAFDLDGSVVAEARREYPLSSPLPDHWELDAEAVWQAVKTCIREAAARTGSNPITAFAISALGEAVVPVGVDRRPLCGAPVSADFRAPVEAAALRERFGEKRIYEITGQPVSALYSLTKMMWWKANTPELYSRTWKFMCFGEYVLARMGLDPVIDYSMACRTLAFDVHQLAWSSEILTATDIPETKLAATAPSGTVVGTVGDDVAAELGLPPGVIAVTGGFDQTCGALGVGVIAEGMGFYGLGTTEALALVMPDPYPDLSAINVALCPHVVPGKMVAMAGSQTGGRLLRWYKDEFACEERQISESDGRDVYEVIIEGISAEPSSLLVLPHFAGSGTVHSDPYSKGAIVGLTFDTRRSDVAKAILEGITYEQAMCLDYLDAVGVRIEQLMVVGGGARSKTWLQIKSDILGRRLQRQGIADAACLGAAIIAGVATQVYPDMAAAVSRTSGPIETFLPDPGRVGRYGQRLALYKGLHGKLADIARALHPA